MLPDSRILTRMSIVSGDIKKWLCTWRSGLGDDLSILFSNLVLTQIISNFDLPEDRISQFTLDHSHMNAIRISAEDGA